MVDLAKSIQDLGLAGIIVLIIVVATVGLARQWWAPGWMYRQERDGRITAETQAVRNAESLAKSAEAYAEMSKALADLSKAYTALRRLAANDRARPRPIGVPDDPG